MTRLFRTLPFFITLFAFSFALTGCGKGEDNKSKGGGSDVSRETENASQGGEENSGDPAKEKDKTGDRTKEKGKDNAKSEDGKKKDPAKKEKPPEQKAEYSISFHHSKVPGKDFKCTHVEAIKHKMKTGGKPLKVYPMIMVHMADYDRGDSSYLPNPKNKGDRRVLISFSAPVGKELKAGKYEAASKFRNMGEGYAVSLGFETRTEPGFSGSVNDGVYGNLTGTAELTSVSDSGISGKVDLKDSKGNWVKATFTTKVEVSPY